MPQPIKLFCVSCLMQTAHIPGGDPLAMHCDCGQTHIAQDHNDIHRNLEAIVMIAKADAKDHNCNYNIILMNPIDGQLGEGSTYEMVRDSYFEKERPNVKLIATTLQLGVIVYDEWIPYTEYEKAECDIKLHDDTIIMHCYPNAGKFNPLCADIDAVPEKEVKEIMYRKYYADGLCNQDCNNTNGIARLKKDLNQINDMETQKIIDHFSNPRHYGERFTRVNQNRIQNRVVEVRTEPKIQRNELCTCGSGKKYKKCCINK